MAVADYPDYDALNTILAVLGTPAQNTGSNSLASLLSQLISMETTLNSQLTQLGNIITSLGSVVTNIQTGSPPITNPVLLANAGFLAAIGAGAVATFGPFATTGSSYSISFQPGKIGRGTTPSMSLFITITDSAGNTVDAVQWDVPQASAGETTNYIFEGPIASGNIFAEILNNDSTASAYNFTLTATQLPLSKHFGQAINFASVPGFTIPSNLNSQELLLDLTTASIAAGGTLVHLLPPSSGQLGISLRSHNTSGNMLAQLFPYTSANSWAGTGGAPIWAGTMTTAAELSAIIPLPRCSTIIKIANNAVTTANTVDVGLVAIPT